MNRCVKERIAGHLIFRPIVVGLSAAELYRGNRKCRRNRQSTCVRVRYAFVDLFVCFATEQFNCHKNNIERAQNQNTPRNRQFEYENNNSTNTH